MTTSSQEQFKINGVIDTSKPVLDNLEILATASGCFFTFNPHTGLWGVIINKAGSPVASFNDSNILGSISVSGTGLTDFYNAVQVDYPHKDLLDARDTSTYEIALADRFPNEIDNILNIKFDIINNPVQAEMLALMQLKQSRVDKVINFRTDYSNLKVQAGDLISVTNEAYGFDAKVFRIISIEEEDSDSGEIILSISGLEYDEAVYDFTDLERFIRDPANGIINKRANTALQQLDDQAYGAKLTDMLIPLAVTDLFNFLFSKNPLTGKITAKMQTKVNEGTMVNPATVAGPNDICTGETATVTASYACCVKDGSTLEYSITGVGTSDIGVPLTGTATFTSKVATLAIPITATSNKTMIVNFGGDTGCSSKTINIHAQAFTVNAAASPTSINEGQSSTITVTTTGISDGYSLPYTVTGTASTSPTSGNVTITSNTGTISISTSGSGSTDEKSFTVTVGMPGGDTYCCPATGTPAATVTVKGTNQVVPVTPGTGGGCDYVSIPLAWCGGYDQSGKLVSASPSATISVLRAYSGGPSVTVPLTVTVTPGSPSTITAATTVAVDATTGKGGVSANIITTFNSAAVGSKVITGTTTTVIGAP